MADPDLKKCGRCGSSKPLEEFLFKHRERGIRHSWCRPCFAAYKHDWYLRRREHHLEVVRRNQARSSVENVARMWSYLAQHPCVDCGETDIVVLEFDHVRDKRQNVSYMARAAFAWETIEAEIAKCEVRCANCHRRKTARERGYYDQKQNWSLKENSAYCPAQLSAIMEAWAVSSVDRAPTL